MSGSGAAPRGIFRRKLLHERCSSLFRRNPRLQQLRQGGAPGAELAGSTELVAQTLQALAVHAVCQVHAKLEGVLNHRCSHTIHHAHRQGLRTVTTHGDHFGPGEVGVEAHETFEQLCAGHGALCLRSGVQEAQSRLKDSDFLKVVDTQEHPAIRRQVSLGCMADPAILGPAPFQQQELCSAGATLAGLENALSARWSHGIHGEVERDARLAIR
mmetsp:Transcript_45010/g.97965  ORF Transcript_45010/g.97965 Transcript_45010/m.97965 type:complete len:214 (+) Transcript_45010:36-677(+)